MRNVNNEQNEIYMKFTKTSHQHPNETSKEKETRIKKEKQQDEDYKQSCKENELKNNKKK